MAPVPMNATTRIPLEDWARNNPGNLKPNSKQLEELAKTTQFTKKQIRDYFVRQRKLRGITQAQLSNTSNDYNSMPGVVTTQPSVSSYQPAYPMPVVVQQPPVTSHFAHPSMPSSNVIYVMPQNFPIDKTSTELVAENTNKSFCNTALPTVQINLTVLPVVEAAPVVDPEFEQHLEIDSSVFFDDGEEHEFSSLNVSDPPTPPPASTTNEEHEMLWKKWKQIY